MLHFKIFLLLLHSSNINTYSPNINELTTESYDKYKNTFY